MNQFFTASAIKGGRTVDKQSVEADDLKSVVNEQLAAGADHVEIIGHVDQAAFDAYIDQ